jgi:hypothetical protein
MHLKVPSGDKSFKYIISVFNVVFFRDLRNLERFHLQGITGMLTVCNVILNL